MKKSLNTSLIYILSIFGLLCCCFGGLGIFLSGPAVLVANKKVKDAQLNPEEHEGDLKAMETAKTVSLVIFIINSLYLIYTIYVIATGDFSELREQWEKAMQEMNQSA